jgi:hypothetical protein
MQETSVELVSVINQQAKDLSHFIESINRRLDRIFREMSSGTARAAAPSEDALLDSAEPAKEFQIPEQFAQDPAHQKAWRIARVMASDLEAYYGDKVREGVLYDNFAELLKDPIAENRRTYEQRVSPKVVSEFDYFALALEELVGRKKAEIAKETASE